MDGQPTIKEIVTHAQTAKWNKLGVALELNSIALAGCHDCTHMYLLWIQEKGHNATRRNLLVALKDIRENNVAIHYEHYLKTSVSYIVYVSLCICIYN